MKKLLRPQVIIPVVLSVAIIAALLAFANIGKIITLITKFPLLYLLWFFLLMVGYEAIRGAQWHLLLRALSVRAPLRSQIFAFAVGEITKSIPVGNYFQNYLLQQSKDEDFGRTSAATTLIIVLEVGVSSLGVVIIGLGSWTGWLRPLIIVGTLVAALVAWAYHRFHQSSRMPKWIREHKRLRKAADEFRQFRKGAEDLLHPRVLAVAALLSAAYLLTAGSALYIVVKGLSPHNGVAFPDVLAVYFFSLAFSLIFPLPIDIGVVEVSAVGAFLAIGVDRSLAVGAELLNRILGVVSALIIAAIAMVILRDEFHAALQSRGGGEAEAREEQEGHTKQSGRTAADMP